MANQYSTICSAFAGSVQVRRSEAKTAIGSIAMKVHYCAVVRVHSLADALHARVFQYMSHDECSSHAQLQRMAAQIYKFGVDVLGGNLNPGCKDSSVPHRMSTD